MEKDTSVIDDFSSVEEKINKYKFYGRRKGRPIKSSKNNIYKALLDKIRINPEDYDQQDKWFVKKQELWLEIGFGNGEHLANQVKGNPHINMIGAEPFVNSVFSCMKKIHDNNTYDNIRIIADDVRYFLDQSPQGIFKMIFILYPDPWHKKRHNKRRLINPDSLKKFASLLTENGILRFVSDHEDYVSWSLYHAEKSGLFQWQAQSCDDWLTPPSNWYTTKYEQKALKEGRVCSYIDFKKI